MTYRSFTIKPAGDQFVVRSGGMDRFFPTVEAAKGMIDVWWSRSS